jgi:viroplasmin and RNaseH domain-containing protein
MPKQKYYVVWKGHKTGIFTSWAECEKQVKGVVDAQFKAFGSDAEAEAAYLANYDDYKGKASSTENGDWQAQNLCFHPFVWMRPVTVHRVNWNIAA